MNAPMGKPNRLKDMLGVLLLVAVGLLYVAGVTRAPHAADVDPGDEIEMMGASSPLEQSIEVRAVQGLRT